MTRWKDRNSYLLQKTRYATWDLWLDLRAKYLDRPSVQERRLRRYKQKIKNIENDKKINRNDFLP